MQYILLLLFSAFSSLWFRLPAKRILTVGIWVLIIFLSLFAGTRTSGVDRDYHIYEQYFRLALLSPGHLYYIYPTVEPITSLVPNLFKLFQLSSEHIINASFLLFGFLGVSLKIYLIRKYSVNFLLSIVLYCSNLYLIQEMTTIRAGVASGAILLAIVLFAEKSYIKVLLAVGAALLCHYSSAIIIPVLIAIRFGVSYRALYIGLLTAIGLSFINFNLLDQINLGSVFAKVDSYLSKESEELNKFNFRIIFALISLAIFSFAKHHIINNRYLDVLLKVHICSLIIFFVFSNFNITFSLRLFELISSIQLLLYPMLILCFSRSLRWLPVAMVLSLSVAQLTYLVYISEIMGPYDSWLF